MSTSPRVLVGVVGPTGSGKSFLACELALRFGGEVVSCDALQVYRGLDLGTGKLTLEERRGVPHHLIDVRDPDVEFSAADYMREAARAVRDVTARGSLPIVAGGTGLYFRALTKGLFEGPGRDAALRARLREMADRRGAEGDAFLHRLLGRFDRESAERLHPNDRVRVLRALEITLRARRPMSELIAERKSPLDGYRVVVIGLAPPRGVLRERIALRVARMFELGLVDETRRLVRAYGAGASAFKAIGYREVLRHLAGAISVEDAERLTVEATARYAKRQMTWFRAEPGVQWISSVGEDPAATEAAAAAIARELPVASLPREEGLHAKAAL